VDLAAVAGRRAGRLPAIVGPGALANVQTVFVKAADGTSLWEQFSPTLVASSSCRAARVRLAVHLRLQSGRRGGHGGPGDRPRRRLLRDRAEAEYEGHYATPSRRACAARPRGGSYPLRAERFPYVDYHPGFPLLGLLARAPPRPTSRQIYWKAIGQRAFDQAFAHTWPLSQAS